MKFITLKFPVMALAMLCIAASAFADIKIKTKTGTGGHNFESVTYIKGARQRSDQGAGLTMLYQCDLKRMIQLNDDAKTYMITPLDEKVAGDEGEAVEKAEPEKRTQTKTRRGGIVTFTVTISDTGERKEMFGFTARHIKTSMVKEASPDACDPNGMRMESDGWYIDLEYGLYCSSDKPAMPPQTRFDKPDCKDEVRFKQIGKAKLGYPLVISTTIYGEGGKSFTSSMEVVELSKSALDQSLFEIPAGYREAKNYQELMGMPSTPSLTERMPSREADEDADDSGRSIAVDAKRPGAIRVGVVAFNSKIDLKASLDSLQYALVGNIESSNVDAVPLDGRSPAEIETEAKSKQCDYLLYTDISEMKKPSAASKIGGGMLGKIGGLGGGGKCEARVDFKLFPLGVSSARLTSSVSAKEEGGEDAALSTALEKEAKAVVNEIQKRK